MKLPELKRRLANKYSVRIISGVLTIALLGSGLSAYTVYADNDKKDSEVVSEENDKDKKDDDLDLDAESLLGNIDISENEVDKDETVYLISDAAGKVDSTIVVDHLYNRDGKDTIKDVSDLDDIKNVKGKEEFSKSGENVTWQANGSDIYYQGTTSTQVPVSQSVEYYLDGKEITPEDLAGKSGKVTIRFNYTNNSEYTAKVNGEDVTVKTPFAAVTALMLDDSFTNVQVTNGKVQNSGETNIVLGYALPGLTESLGLDDDDLDSDVKIPEYFEVTADVEDFSLSNAMTVVVNAGSLLTSEGEKDEDSIDEVIGKLQDASSQLEDGSSALAEGTGTLKDSLGEFVDGMSSLKEGIEAYTDGASSLDKGISKVDAGVSKLDKSKKSLSTGVTKLSEGSTSAVAGASKLVTGSKSLYEGTKTLSSGAKTLETGISSLESGVTSLETGIDTLGESTPTLEGGAKSVYEGAVSLADGASKVDAGVDKLVTTLNGMGATLESSATSTLSKFSSYKSLFAALGYKDGVTASNIGEVATAVAGNQSTVVGALKSQGMSEENANATYVKLVSGLFEAKGAMTVINQVSSGLNSNSSDLQTLAAGTEALKNGSAELSKGSKSVYEGTVKVNEAVGQLSKGASKIAKGAGSVSKGATSLSKGASSLKSGAKQVYEGNKSLASGLKTLDNGLGSLSDKVPSLVDGITQLKSGTSQLATGSSKLVSNNKDLLSGASKLYEGTGKISDGVDELDDGANKLADGIVEFNEEGINKIVNAYDGDIKPLADRLQAVIDAGNDYQAFTKVADSTKGSVKFIYKLGEIKK